MDNVFGLFADVTKDAQKSEHKILNSEMDDLEIPEGIEFPSTDSLLKLTTTLDTKARDIDATPVASQNPHPSHSFESEEESRSVSPDIPEEKDLGHEFLSVTSDVNAHSDQIHELSSQMRAQDAKISQVVELDSLVRKLKSEIADMMSDIKELKSVTIELRKSFTQYQTITAQKIADVERRAVTKQLISSAVADVESLVPPAEVSVERTESRVSESQTPGSSSVIATKNTPLVIDLSDF